MYYICNVIQFRITLIFKIMKAIYDDYEQMLHNNINNKEKFNNFYELVRRAAIKYDTTIKRAYWCLSFELTPIYK